jgi:TonB family protein
MEAHLKEDFPGAEALYQRVLDLWEQPASPETALARRGLAAIAQQRGELPRDLQALPEVRFTTLEGSQATAWPASQAYRVGGGVSSPSVVSKVQPQYSREARLVKFQGTVVLQVTIQTDGSVGDVRVQNPLGLGLEVKAVEAVRQWRFQPGMKDGVPVPVRAQIEVNFRLL